MNYRHAYHAGSFADVLKHAVLALIVDYLTRKPAPFRVIDTHGGIGRYDLAAEPALKTGEAAQGIQRLLAGPPPPEALKPYLSAVRALNPGDGPVRWYPGSPRIVRHLLRPHDRQSVVELHPEDARALAAEFARDRQVTVHHGDAYAALKAMLPPPERRGLVLIDPPFEKRDEFATVIKALRAALKRWPTGVYGIWYPIKAHAPVRAFQAELAGLGPPPTLAADFLIRPDDDASRLNGCGLVLINPPWILDRALAALMPDLLVRLGYPDGSTALTWLVPA